jgi:hypothetical protein
MQQQQQQLQHVELFAGLDAAVASQQLQQQQQPPSSMSERVQLLHQYEIQQTDPVLVYVSAAPAAVCCFFVPQPFVVTLPYRDAGLGALCLYRCLFVVLYVSCGSQAHTCV